MFSSILERDESLEIEPESVLETMTSIATEPRVGGVHDKVPWTGGSNLDEQKNEAPTDVLCFRPENFKEMQK